MAKRGKKYLESSNKVDREKNYSLDEACQLLKDASFAKFNESVELAINLGVDPRHADQNIRGAVPLPHGLGKAVRIVVFAKGEKVSEAKDPSVVGVGAEELAKKIQDENWLDFDHVIATPDMMGVVGRLGKILGPRGLMPNPKLGTVTFEVSKAISELNAGRAEYRCDKAGIIHSPVGKVAFEASQLSENSQAVIDALLKAKPASAKGTYLKRIVVSSTMGPGIRVDTAPFKL